jgi:hypothetical protein
VSGADRGAPSWLWFAAKILIAALWLGAGAFSAATVLRGENVLAVSLACAFIFMAPAAWIVLKASAIARVDEAEAQANFRALIQGLLMAIFLPGAMLAGSALSSLFLGDGRVNVSGLTQNALTLVFILPPLAFFMSELATFAILRLYAGKPRQ